MAANRKGSNPSLLHTPNDAVEVIGDRKRWEAVKAHVIKVCGPKFGKVVYQANQLMVCRKVLGRSTPEEVQRFNGFSGTWADDVAFEVAEFGHSMANSKRLQVTMDSCLAEYKNDKAASPDRQQKRQKTGEDNTDSAILAVLQKLDASLSELTSRVDQLDPQVTELPHKQRDVVSELQKGVASTRQVPATSSSPRT